mgnify:CR=1 FL=1
MVVCMYQCDNIYIHIAKYYLCFFSLCRLTSQPVTRPTGRRGRLTLGCILGGPLVGLKLDTGWQGRLVSVYMSVLNCGGLD